MSTRLPAAERRDQLIAVAVRVFAASGFHQTSMNDIAEAAGVTKPVLYQHFASKRQLFLELLSDVGERLRSTIAKATAEAHTARAQVELGMAAYLRFVADDRQAFTLLFGSGSRRDEEFSAAVRKVEDMIAETIAGLITADVEDDHRRLLAYAIVGLAEGASRHLVQTGNLDDPEETAARIAELAWAGLRGVRRSER